MEPVHGFTLPSPRGLALDRGALKWHSMIYL